MIDIKKLFERIYNRIYIPIYKKKMGNCGKRVYFSPCNSVFLYETMYVGDDVYIGDHADFVASRSKIIINDHVMFAPHVSIGEVTIGIMWSANFLMKLRILTNYPKMMKI